MKKLLLSISALAALTAAQAQQRLSLYEEFSGENCGPCALANPDLWALVSGSGNASKILLIKYQSPIPSAGPIYNQYTTAYQQRGNTYYDVPFAPYGRLNGKEQGSGSNAGHVSLLTQADINAEAAMPAPFNISVTHTWNSTLTQVTANITVTAVNALPANSNLKMHVALLEHLVYDFPPGTNGETDFHNVVRQMYPDPSGTALPMAWTAGQSQTFTITGNVPSYVDKAGTDTRLVVWIQDDSDKSVEQAATSPANPPVMDVASSSLNMPQTLACAAGTTASMTPSVTIKNTGSTTLTSATIYYKLDNGAWQSHPWTGSLAAGATSNVTLPAMSVGTGAHVLIDSVALPNATTDYNTANNNDFKQVWVQNTTPNALPISTGFENNGTMPTNWMLYDVNGDFENWQLVWGSNPNANIGHANSKYLLMHENFSFADGESNVAIFPTPQLPTGARALDFWVAYAQYQTEQDKLEVVWSDNCGQSWNSIWSQSGTALATRAATTNNFVPTQSEWRFKGVNIPASVPQGAIFGFRATSNFGNNLFVDDIVMRSGTTGIEEVVSSGYVQLIPNPAKDQVTIQFTMNERSNVQIQIIDAMGRVVNNVANEMMNEGTQKVTVNTDNLASGLYNVKISTKAGNRVERLAIVK